MHLSELLFDDMPILPLTLFRSAILFLMFLSLEEILLGVVARVIWKEQWDISISAHLNKTRCKFEETVQLRSDTKNSLDEFNDFTK